jgi:hypothetical protein
VLSPSRGVVLEVAELLRGWCLHLQVESIVSSSGILSLG